VNNGNGTVSPLATPVVRETITGAVLLVCIVLVGTVLVCSFWTYPKYEKGVDEVLIAVIAFVNGILFGKAVSTPIYPTVQPPGSSTTTTTTATTDAGKVTTTTATPAGPVTVAVEAPKG
jgi:hypothetical protein